MWAGWQSVTTTLSRGEIHRHIRENGLADISAAIMIRYQSWLFSIISVFDMLARVARMITCSKCQQRTSRLSDPCNHCRRSCRQKAGKIKLAAGLHAKLVPSAATGLHATASQSRRACTLHPSFAQADLPDICRLLVDHPNRNQVSKPA